MFNLPRVIEHRVNPLLVDRVFADGRHRFAQLQADTSAATRIHHVAQATIGLDQQPKSGRWRNAAIDWLESFLRDYGRRGCFDGRWISIHFLGIDCRHHNYCNFIVSSGELVGWLVESDMKRFFSLVFSIGDMWGRYVWHELITSSEINCN